MSRDMALVKLEHVLFLLPGMFWTLRCLCCVRCVSKAGNQALDTRNISVRLSVKRVNCDK